MFTQCPKYGHTPLPHDQASPAACPACGVILAKVAQALKEDLENTVINTQRMKCSVSFFSLPVNDESSLYNFLFHAHTPIP